MAIITNAGYTSGGASIQDGVVSANSVWSSQYLHSRKTYTQTQWGNTITNTAVLNNTGINLLSFLTDANKNSNGTDVGYIDELNLSGTGSGTYIIMPWRNNGRLLNIIRVNIAIAPGGAQGLGLQLRRKTDNSVISERRVDRSPDRTLEGVEFISYTGSEEDPFVAGSFYVWFDNTSGTSITLTTSVNVLCQTFYSQIPNF